MPVTSNDIANQAIVLMGDNQPPVTGQWPNFDSSTAGDALNRLYGPCVQTVMRQHDWDFARNTVQLAQTGNTPPFPWAYEYVYPANCLQVWQVFPATADIPDLNNPLPTTYVIANAVVTGTQARVIQTSIRTAQAVINNYPSENTWDALFREAMVRLLSSELAIAIAGRPESSQLLLQTGSAFEQIGEARDG